jgi:TolB-like protein
MGTLAAFAAVLLLGAESPAVDKPRLFVASLTAVGVEPAEASAFTDAVVNSLSERSLFKVITTKDLESLLGAERQKQLLGVCERDPTACSQGAAEAVTARFVLSGQLSRLGSAYQLSLQMVDTEKGQAVARALRLSDDLQRLRALVPYVAAEATGSPLPPPPSKVLPIALISVGGATFLAGAVLGMLALSRQAVVNDELCPTGDLALTRCQGVSLRPRDYYLQQDSALGVQKTVSLFLLGGGAVLAALGIVLWPPADTAAVRVAVLPSLGGLAMVGDF